MTTTISNNVSTRNVHENNYDSGHDISFDCQAAPNAVIVCTARTNENAIEEKVANSTDEVRTVSVILSDVNHLWMNSAWGYGGSIACAGAGDAKLDDVATTSSG